MVLNDDNSLNIYKVVEASKMIVFYYLTILHINIYNIYIYIYILIQH